MTTKRTTKTEKYLNFTKFFWNKLSKPWRHHLKSLNNGKIIVWYNKTLKPALITEANFRKWYNIVKYEKKRKPEQKGISWRILLLFFFRNLIRKSKQPLTDIRYLSSLVYLESAIETFNYTIFGIWKQKLTTNEWQKQKKSNSFCKRTVSQPFKPYVIKTKIMFCFKC